MHLGMWPPANLTDNLTSKIKIDFGGPV